MNPDDLENGIYGLTKIKDYNLVQTSIACPQQFSIYKDNEEVAYLRLRHGTFTVNVFYKYRDTSNVFNNDYWKQIYETKTLGDGVFEEEEENIELNIAINKIDEYFNKKYIILDIIEEYGYRNWKALLTECEFDNLVDRWKSIKGLNCLIPVNFIIPQAEISQHDKDIDFIENYKIISCHIHESEDSWIKGVEYKIPDQEDFEMDGKKYTQEQVNRLFEESKKYFI